MTSSDKLLDSLLSGAILDREQARTFVAALLDGAYDDDQAFHALATIEGRDAEPEELMGAADALVDPDTHGGSTASVDGLLQMGGIGSGTTRMFPALVPAAMIAAAVGAPVVLLGDPWSPGDDGGVDLAARLGLDSATSVAEAGDRVASVGFAALPLGSVCPSVAMLADVRRRLGCSTILESAWPLASPLGATRVFIEMIDREFRMEVVESLLRLGDRWSWLATYDQEASGDWCCDYARYNVFERTSATRLTYAQGDWSRDSSAADLALPDAGPDEGVDDGSQVLAAIEAVLRGQRGPTREATLIVAAVAVWTAGLATSLAEAWNRAEQAVADGRAAALLERLRA